MYPMRISDEGNIWRITDEEMQQLRQTMLELQRQSSNDVPDSSSSPSSPSSVCSSNASLDLETFIPSPETFFAEDFGIDSAASQHADQIQTSDVACQTNVAERSEPLSWDVAESLGILMHESVSRDQTTAFKEQPLVQSSVQTIGLGTPPGFPPITQFQFGFPAMPSGFAPDMAARPSAMDYVAFPAHYCSFHFRDVEFYIAGPTRNSVIFPSPEYFHVTCTDPRGEPCFVTCNYSQPNPCWYICKFFATIPGIYTAFVKYWDPMEIGGPINIRSSPLAISVSRDYRNGILESFMLPREVPQYSGNAEFIKIWGMDVDKHTNRVYVTDKKANLVRIYSAEGIELTPHGFLGHGILNRPSGVAVDHHNSRLVISDKDNHRIVFCDLDGIFISSFGEWGSSDGCFRYPWGVAVSPNGELITVADSSNHRLQMFDKFGNYLRKYSVVESNPLGYKALFDSPRGICFDNEGNYVYCSDFNIHVVFRLSIDFQEKIAFTMPGDLLRPQGLTTDQAGNLLVCEKNHCVRVFTPEGKLMAVINGNGNLHHPQDICILPNGKLFILDGYGAIRIY